MKYAFLLLSFLILTIANSQHISMGINATPNLTFPLGNSGTKFWRFPQDTDVVYSKAKAKRTPQFGFTIGPNIFYEGKPKGKIRFVCESILAYSLTRYKINWSVPYQSPTGSGIANIYYGINRHEVSVAFLPGLKYKQWAFQTGLSFLFMLKTTTTTKFSRGNSDYVNETSSDREVVKAGGSKVINISVPFSIAYNFQVIPPLAIQPYLAYDFGIFNFDAYSLGNTPVRSASVLSQLKLGVKVLVQTKKAKK